MGSNRNSTVGRVWKEQRDQERDEEGTTDRNRSYCCAKIIRIAGTSGERVGRVGRERGTQRGDEEGATRSTPASFESNRLYW
jgi:hypothetical protein